LIELASSHSVQSAHDLSDGGLAITLAECCFAAEQTGASVTLQDNAPLESVLFGERGARAVISVSPSQLHGILHLAQEHCVTAKQLGHVTGDSIFSIQYNGSVIIEESTGVLRDIWAHSLERALKQ
jgi:phosphoribosylformylglycinamidine synthase